MKATLKKINLFIQENRYILLILLLGLVVRVIYAAFFSHYIARSYFGQESLFLNTGDFNAWYVAMKNFMATGSYSINLSNDYGFFGRMPGYSIFIAFFYYLFGEPHYMVILGYSQIVMDCFTIYLIYRIWVKLFPQSAYPYLASFLFALHPINILWSPALLSETLSIFLLFLGFHVLLNGRSDYRFLWLGLILGFDVLVRPQILILIAVIAIVYTVLLLYRSNKPVLLKNLFFFLTGVTITYGWWPVKNYLIHDKVIITQNIIGFSTWGIDVHAYMHYILSIQTNWDPQFTQIIKNQPFEIDKKVAYVTPTDSADLAKAVYLSQNYGSGFSNWPGYWKETLPYNKQDTVIAELFTKLQKNQVKYNAFHYWITLPLKNLKKCFFKVEVTKSNNGIIYKFVPLMFLYRTLLIIMGLIGSVLLITQSTHPAFKIIFFFFIGWYFLICFGPSVQMRNIEMRYLLQVDTLMIIPAAYLMHRLTRKNVAVISDPANQETI